MGELTTLDYFEFQAKSGIWGSLYDPKNPASYPFIVRFKKCVDLMDPIENKIIVDLGCGTGVLIPHVIQNGGKYIGVDISQNMIDVIKEEYSSLIESKKVSLYYGDITNFNSSNNAEIMVGLGFIEYFEDPQSIVDRLYGQLPKNGQLILSFPNLNSLDYFSVMLFSPIRFVMRTVFGKSTSQPPRILWNKKKAKKLFENTGFKDLKLVSYNINIFAYPFTRVNRRFTNFFAKLFEYSMLSRFSFFSTGFIISAKK